MDGLTVVSFTIKYLFTIHIEIVGELLIVLILFILTRYLIYFNTPTRKRLGGPRGGPPFTFTESGCRIGGRKIFNRRESRL